MLNPHIQQVLRDTIQPDTILGLVGYGAFGQEIAEYAVNELHCSKLLLCDPPKALDDLSDIWENTFQLWGNGMGGAPLANPDWENYVPLEQLAIANVISIQVPLIDNPPFATRHLITPDFLSKCRQDLQLLCFSSPEVIHPQALASKQQFKELQELSEAFPSQP